MSHENLYVVRRCDAFYRCWHDITEPEPMPDAMATYDRLTNCGTVCAAPDQIDWYGIFAATDYHPLVRVLQVRDSPMIVDHLLRLDNIDRGLRFFYTASDAQICDYVSRIDWRRSLIIGAVRDENLLGIAEILFDRAVSPRHAEIAVSVDQIARGSGLGRHMIDIAVDHASIRGVAGIGLSFMRQNHAVQQIVRSLGGCLDMIDMTATLPVRHHARVPQLLAS
jgi:GNAT superfamily N-acetyltransferase